MRHPLSPVTGGSAAAKKGRPLQVERALYRGFVFVMDCYEVRVERTDGRRIGSARTLSGARRLVRGYRRAAA